MKCIFRNQLTAEEHKEQFDRILQSASRTLFDVDQTNYFFVPSGSQSTALQYVTQQDWIDIIKRNITICSQFDVVHLKLKEIIIKDTFSISETENIVLYTVVNDLLLETTASICRTLSRSESHLVLTGPTGSMKIDALHIACTYLGIKIASITPAKNYNMNDFYNDLKMVFIEKIASKMGEL